MIEIERLWKLYGSLEAVRDLSFTVESGEILGLVGPNGAGKTSTMRCLCGIIPPSAGDIRVCGLSILDAPVEAKRRIAFVPSEPRFFPYLTVDEHIQMFMRLYQCERSAEEVDVLLEHLVLHEKRHHLPTALSRGMQQKLMIACGLIHRPDVLVFDEPFTGLDPLAIRTIRKVLRSSAEEGASILISSHLLAMVEDLVDRVLIIQEGAKVAHERVDTLIERLPAEYKEATLEEIFFHLTQRQSEPLDIQIESTEEYSEQPATDGLVSKAESDVSAESGADAESEIKSSFTSTWEPVSESKESESVQALHTSERVDEQAPKEDLLEPSAEMCIESEQEIEGASVAASELDVQLDKKAWNYEHDPEAVETNRWLTSDEEKNS